MAKYGVVKILVKDHHDSKEDLVSRPLVRGFKKINQGGVSNFITENGVYLYGYLEDDSVYEVFTERPLEVENLEYEEATSNELVCNVRCLKEEEIGKMHALIDKLVFGQKAKMDLEISTMEEKAMDRNVFFEEYNNGLTSINPYERGFENDYDKSLMERVQIEKGKVSGRGK